MATQQMGMTAAPSPEEMAVFDQMRQNISPKEFSDEMLAGAEQVDPQAVAEFRQELDGLDMPPEVLDALNDLVDEILANPERYDEIRQKYISQGIPDDFLPEQFDPQFFAALNMAIDQMVGAPAGPQAFAKGGIAELKPIAKAIASYGRNGDTMLAHITPAEARMLKRRGGSGTINPKTGLPEFFLGKIFKSVGKALKKVGSAVKKFANSTVGRLVTTVALGFFLGPAAASMMGVSAGSAAGMAISGFVGSAGSTLLGGGNLRDALKAGAIGGLTAGAAAGLSGAPLTGAATMTPGEALSSQFQKVTSAFSPTPLQQSIAQVPPAQGTTPAPLGVQTATQAPVPDTSGAFIEPGSGPMGEMPAAEVPMPYDPATATRAVDYGYKPGGPEGITDRFKGYLDKISPSKIQETGAVQADLAGQKAMEAHQARMAAMGKTATAEGLEQVYQTARKAAMPGAIATYGPATALGIGALGAAGGFTPKQPPMPAAALELEARRAADRKMMEENPGMFTPKGFEPFGAVYNNKGQIVEWKPWTTESARAYQERNVPMTTAFGGIASLAQTPVRMADGGSVGPTAAQLEQARAMGLSDLPSQWGTYSPDQKISYFNAMSVSPSALAASGVSQSDIDWMQSQGYTGGKGPTAAQLSQAQQMGLSDLPSQWGTYSPDQKISYFNLTNVTPAELAASGVSPSDIDWMKSQGYTGGTGATGGTTPANTDAAKMLAELRDLLAQQKLLMQQKPAATVQSPQATTFSIPAFSAAQPSNQPSMVSTPSVLGGQVLGLTDPFAAGKINPLDYVIRTPYNTSAMYPNIFQPKQKVMATGGIATLGSGGYPRRTGQIEGPGTETSDEIPAMLSDGEFVMTAKAVRGAGGGSRREGAKKMYALMHRLEKNAAKG